MDSICIHDEALPRARYVFVTGLETMHQCVDGEDEAETGNLAAPPSRPGASYKQLGTAGTSGMPGGATGSVQWGALPHIMHRDDGSVSQCATDTSH